MRQISFYLTTDQVRARQKTVTRRTGWATLKVGDQLQAVEKGQGLKKGEKANKLAIIQVVAVSREWMSDFVNRPDAAAECAREGFPFMTPREFVTMFRRHHADPSADDLQVTRIEFSYVPAEP